jgi:hypothetical protein
MSQQGQIAQEKLSTSKFHGLWALTNRELKNWLQQPFVFVMGLIHPLLWLALLGKAMNIGNLFSAANMPPMPTLTPALTASQLQGLTAYFGSFQNTIMQSTFGTGDYFSFMAMSMVAFTVVFTTAFTGMSVVWDKRLGFMNKVLSTPVSRSSIHTVKGTFSKHTGNVPSSHSNGSSVRIRTGNRQQLCMVEHPWSLRNRVPHQRWPLITLHCSHIARHKNGNAPSNLPANHPAVDDGEQRVFPDKPDARLVTSSRKLEPNILHNRRSPQAHGVQRWNGDIPTGARKPKFSF